jgi:hypothetical protein
VVIWVAPRFHEEFRRGLDWLNDRTDSKVDFFGVEIGLVRIGRSLPAPVLDVVVQPRNWRKSGRRRVQLPVGSLFPGTPPPASPPRHAAAEAVPEDQQAPAPAREPPLPAAPDTSSPVAGSPLTAAPAPPPPPPEPSPPPLEPSFEPSFDPEPSARYLPASPPPMASEQAGGLQPVELRHRFFESMFDSVAIRRPGFRIPKFGYENWVGFAAGPFGFYDVAFTANGAVRAGVYLDMQERTATKRLFDDLFSERLAVETAVGRILSWERLDDRRASRIVDYREVRDLGNLQDRLALADWAAETVVKLMEALDDRLRSTAQVLLSRVQGGV